MNFFNSLMKLLQDAQVMPVVQRLGWMILHSLWQGAALAILLRIFLAATRWRAGVRWTNFRYAGACAVLAAFAVCAVATFVISSPNTPMPTHHGQTLAPSPSFSGTISSFQAVSIAPAPPRRFDWQSLIPLLVLIWMAGVLMLSARYFVAWLRIRQLQREESLRHSLWTQALQPLVDRLGIHRMVRLVGSSKVGVPVVIGAFKPVIVIPLAIVNGLSPQQVQAILAHELAHVRRYDYFVNLLQTALEAIFFYHPAVWWISAQIRNERENCCDDVAAMACGDRLNYASALVALEEQCGGSHAMALAATDGSLLQRVRRLLPAPSPRRPLLRANRAALVALICPAMLIAGECLIRTHAEVAKAAQPDTSKPQPPATQAKVNEIDKATQAQLDRRLPEIKFEGNAFSDVIDFLRDVSGAKIFVNWHVLEAAGVAKDAPVTLNLKDVKFSTVLQLLLENVGGGTAKLSYSVVDGVIQISTTDANQAAEAQLDRVLSEINSDVINSLRDPATQAIDEMTAYHIELLHDTIKAKLASREKALLDYRELASRYGENNPAVVKLKNELELIDKDISTSTDEYRQAAKMQAAMTEKVESGDKKIDPAEQALLDRRLPQIKFDNNPLADVIDFLRDVTGANIFVNWHTLEAAGIAKDTPVNANLKDVKFSTVLQLILDDAGGGHGKIDYFIDDNVIRISTADDINKIIPPKIIAKWSGLTESPAPATKP